MNLRLAAVPWGLVLIRKRHLRLESVALLLTCAYLFVLLLPGVATIREATLFIAIVIMVYVEVKSKRWKWPPLTVLFFFWLAVSLLSLFASRDILHSLAEIKKDVLYPIMAFWLLYSVTKGKRELSYLSAGFFLSIFCILVASYISYYYLGLRYETLHSRGYLFGSKSYYVFMLLAVTSLAVLFVMPGTKSTVFRFCCALLIPVSIFATYFARLRSGYLAIVAAVSVYLVYTNFIRKSIKRKALLLSCMVLVAFLVPGMITHRNFFLSLNTDSLGSAIKSLRHEERLVIWNKAVSEISRKPILGNGFGYDEVNVVLEKKLIDYPEVPSYTLDAHNLFLNYGLMTGVGGTIVLFALFGRVYWLLHKKAVLFLGTDLFRFNVVLSGLLVLTVFVTINMTSDIMTRHTGQLFWAFMGLFFGAVRDPV